MAVESCSVHDSLVFSHGGDHELRLTGKVAERVSCVFRAIVLRLQHHPSSVVFPNAEQSKHVLVDKEQYHSSNCGALQARQGCLQLVNFSRSIARACVYA